MKIKKELGARFSKLAVQEPGILSRLDHFIKFGATFLKRNPSGTAGELLAAYRKFLGKSVFYRGLALTKAEFENLIINGMDLPNGLSTEEAKGGVAAIGINEAVQRRVGISLNEIAEADLKKTNLNPTNEQIRNYLNANWTQITERRLEFMNRQKFLASLSRDADVAAWIAWTRKSPEKEVYVFKVIVDVLDTIWGNGFESWIMARIEAQDIEYLNLEYFRKENFQYTEFIDILRQPQITAERLPPITADTPF